MKSYTQWLQSLIDDLNFDTFIEEPWSVEFIDQSGQRQIIGNSRVSMEKKNGIWVHTLDREPGEFSTIKSSLELAQTILKVNRIGRNGKGEENLPSHYEKVFRIDTFMDEQGEMAVLLDREDNIIEKMQLRASLNFVDRFELPVSILGFKDRFETTQYVMLDDGFIVAVSEKISDKVDAE